MLYVQITARLNGKPVQAVATKFDYATMDPTNYENRNDWKTFEQAQDIAKALGDGFIAIDAGAYVSPRYDVIELPKLGDDVSYGFNCDYYPCGKIVKISKAPGYKRIATSDGSVFYRRAASGSWIKNQTWVMVKGVVNERNPEF